MRSTTWGTDPTIRKRTEETNYETSLSPYGETGERSVVLRLIRYHRGHPQWLTIWIPVDEVPALAEALTRDN